MQSKANGMQSRLMAMNGALLTLRLLLEVLRSLHILHHITSLTVQLEASGVDVNFVVLVVQRPCACNESGPQRLHSTAQLRHLTAPHSTSQHLTRS